ncbi:MAG: hypothetical protein IPJ55_14105 [Chloracidobacterium sp.]|nr:hypothetical protein [Chloracidobacterium sp.]
MICKIFMLAVAAGFLNVATVCLAQDVITSSTPYPIARNDRELLGLKLRPETLAIVKEIEAKTRKPIVAEFNKQPKFQLGVSFIDEQNGQAIVSLDPARKTAISSKQFSRTNCSIYVSPSTAIRALSGLQSSAPPRALRLMWNRATSMIFEVLSSIVFFVT